MTAAEVGSEQNVELEFLTAPQVIEEIGSAGNGVGACPQCGSSDCTGCESGDGSDPCE